MENTITVTIRLNANEKLVAFAEVNVVAEVFVAKYNSIKLWKNADQSIRVSFPDDGTWTDKRGIKHRKYFYTFNKETYEALVTKITEAYVKEENDISEFKAECEAEAVAA